MEASIVMRISERISVFAESLKYSRDIIVFYIIILIYHLQLTVLFFEYHPDNLDVSETDMAANCTDCSKLPNCTKLYPTVPNLHQKRTKYDFVLLSEIILVCNLLSFCLFFDCYRSVLVHCINFTSTLTSTFTFTSTTVKDKFSQKANSYIYFNTL